MKYLYNDQWYYVEIKAVDTIPTGAIIEFPSLTAPYGYLLCDGRAVSRTTYADLFAVYGTRFGTGDGSTTFNLPDYSGRTGVGIDENDTDFDTIGKTLGSKEMQRHTHPVGIDGGTNSGSEINFTFGSDQRIYTPTSDGDIIGFAGTGDSGNIQPSIVSAYYVKYEQSVGVVANVHNESNSSEQDVYSTKYINENFLRVVQLYKTTSPNNSVVNLNDNIANYKYIEVIGAGADGGRISSGKVCVDNNMQINIVGTSMRDNQATVAFWFTTLLASGTTLTPQTSKWLYITPGSSAFGFGDGNYLSVLEVIGYK